MAPQTISSIAAVNGDGATTNGDVTTVHTDVVIVGAGPAGASLACFLSSYGIKGIIVDLNSTSADTPRAHITSMAALECLRDIGLDVVAEKLATKGDCMMHTRWAHSMAGREYARIYSWGNDPRRKGEYERASPCSPVDLPQTLLEPELVRYATLNGFQIRWNTEFQSFEQDADGVTAHLEDKITKLTYAIKAKYLFGADGARSKIMTQLDIPLDKHPGGGPAINVLVKADLSHLVKHRMGNLHWIMQPDREHPEFGWMSIVRMVKPWHEWMFILFPSPGSDLSRRPSKEEYLGRIRELIGDDTPAEILRVNVWNINEIVAETYSKGRVYCLGDAVHRHPPFNGLGSNTCIQDAFNLAWKIAYVMQNKAGPEILSTYSQERQPVGKSIVKRANDGFRDHAHIWNAIGITLPTLAERKALLSELATNSQVGRSSRKKLQEAVAQSEHEFHGLGIEMNQVYASSAIQADNDPSLNQTIENSDVVLYHIPSTIPGRRLPHVWLNTAVPSGLVSTIDLAGKGGFTLFTGIGGEAWKPAATKISEQLGIPIRVYSIGFDQDYEDPYFDWMRVREVEDSGCVLIRPDRFVAWRSKAVAEDAEAALGKVIKAILSK
ncbi:2,4-dichlorophenol 6-monooxygenase [Mytilinidion resinicola]|uniref:2,4-dichlorophenol 6-monooxygenase n=1 Tax=Mytilinidion resinicola TaxID=574789 RepID=A0A6A6Z4G0_9PEZI|nr:2,4-dichlorophenol 6-monooxygenase [Mytilinidion resinicola]KAF2815543.1 2,4-dichlorophenol 6-monooxygenase [Mytilinidion resinicola]